MSPPETRSRSYRRLLVVHHSPSASMRELTEAVVAGTHDEAIEGVGVSVRPALQATAQDVLGANGIILGTPANFGYMSGALKHFFDSTFLQIGGALSDDGSAGEGSGERARSDPGPTPYGLYVHGRYDTTGAIRAVTSIAGALPWRLSAQVLDVLGDIDDGDRSRAYELGATLAALLME
ncbi:MAG: flavodoxin family protein [Micrococcales bacterium]|nr:flavodoxin family protein [Micrococcales bacterium]